MLAVKAVRHVRLATSMTSKVCVVVNSTKILRPILGLISRGQCVNDSIYILRLRLS